MKIKLEIESLINIFSDSNNSFPILDGANLPKAKRG